MMSAGTANKCQHLKRIILDIILDFNYKTQAQTSLHCVRQLNVQQPVLLVKYLHEKSPEKGAK